MEKFHNCVYGRSIVVETDHKPLLSIFSKALNNAPRRLQRMMLRLQNYSFNLVYKPGTQVVVADALSRAYPERNTLSASKQFTEELAFVNEQSEFEIELQNNQCLHLLVASTTLKEMLTHASKEDRTISEIAEVIKQGWPNDSTGLSTTLQELFNYRDELVIEDGLLFKGERLFVPCSVRDELMNRIHASHIGINGCLRRARDSVFWPNMTRDITRVVSACEVCCKLQGEQSKEPLQSHEIADRPWKIIGCDIFEYNHTSYLMTVDYYSNFFEVDRLTDKKGPEVIRHIKAHMSRYGIVDVLRSDNGPPFQSEDFKRFSRDYEFEHITSSPRYAQSNGKVENAIKTVKRLMRRATEARADPYLALLDWRNTPSEGFNASPAQRLLGRRVRTLFPTRDTLLQVPGSAQNISNARKAQDKQAKYYNRNAHAKPEIPVQSTVRFRMDEKTDWRKGEISRKLPFRSYEIRTQDGATYRRNRKHVRFSNEPPLIYSDTSPDPTTSAAKIAPKPPSMTLPSQPSRRDTSAQQPTVTTRYGRVVKKPSKYMDYVT